MYDETHWDLFKCITKSHQGNLGPGTIPRFNYVCAKLGQLRHVWYYFFKESNHLRFGMFVLKAIVAKQNREGHFRTNVVDPDSGLFRARICKRLRSPGIDSEESIPSAYVAWRAGTTTLFLLSSSLHRLFKNSGTGQRDPFLFRSSRNTDPRQRKLPSKKGKKENLMFKELHFFSGGFS
jgi:hypothetical protein